MIRRPAPVAYLTTVRYGVIERAPVGGLSSLPPACTEGILTATAPPDNAASTARGNPPPFCPAVVRVKNP